MLTLALAAFGLGLVQLETLRLAIGVAGVAYLLRRSPIRRTSRIGPRWAARSVRSASRPRITYCACALAFLGLALASLRDLLGGAREPAAAEPRAPVSRGLLP
jgi:hypothetical protein